MNSRFKLYLSGIQALVLFLIWVTFAYADDPSDLDTTFKGTGFITATNPYIGFSVAIQPDKKILVVGEGTGSTFGVARYNSDGDLDTSFNHTGIVTTSVSNGFDWGSSIAIQDDGKIVVAGESDSGGGGQGSFAVVRYLTDGTLDTSFNGTGIVTTPLQSDDDIGLAVALQTDGRIVVTSNSRRNSVLDFTVVRYNSDGSLDTNFNSTGIVTTPVGSSFSGGYSIAIQPDNKIVVVGHSDSGGFDSDFSDFTVLRYDSSGNLDASFNNTGIVTTSIGSKNDFAYSVALQTDGKIVVAGNSGELNNSDFAVARYTIDGNLDTTFNNTGIVTTPITTGDDEARSVTIQPNGKIIVAGSDGFYFAIVRYNNDGSLDTTFNNTGVVTTPLGSAYGRGFSAILQTDGKIVVVGQSNSNLALVRYKGDSIGEVYLPVVLKH